MSMLLICLEFNSPSGTSPALSHHLVHERHNGPASERKKQRAPHTIPRANEEHPPLTPADGQVDLIEARRMALDTWRMEQAGLWDAMDAGLRTCVHRRAIQDAMSPEEAIDACLDFYDESIAFDNE